jgi:2-dehydropantoate 2-reductase
MHILVLGAGALGGYFGGRLAAAGRDVTFLVRPARAEQLREQGLVIRSPRGDLTLREVRTATEATLHSSPAFDLILLTCKAYDLEAAMASLAPAVGSATLILPVLNGMRHLDALRQRFGAQAVLGGVCEIAATLNAQHEIVHFNDRHSLTFGELDGRMTDRLAAVNAALGQAGFDAKASGQIVRDLWEKWIFLAPLAASTCLFRAPVGDIVAAPDGPAIMERLLAECLSVAAHNGITASDTSIARIRSMLLAPGSMLTASMLRDVQNGSRTEADHILGDLIGCGGAALQATGKLTLLRIAYSQLKAYEAGRSRSAA